MWGKSAVKEIEIPGIIDDYNHWMLGVDKADQFVAYYRPNLRCRRVWMPLLFHGLDVLRVNAFVAASRLGWKSTATKASHKDFIAGFVKALLARATTYETRITRRGHANASALPEFARKRQQTSTKNPTLPDDRLLGDLREHIKVDASKQRACRMCAYLLQKAKLNRQVPFPKVRRPAKICIYCNVHLCNEHFDDYHRIR